MPDNDVNVAITFNPMLPKYQQIQVTPDPAPLDYGKGQSMSFKLVTSVDGASLDEIEFDGGDAKGPFHDLSKTSETTWEGSNPKREAGQYKYKIKVKTSDGEHELDPLVTSGNPP